MLEPYIGTISMFGCTFAPLGWMFCDGTMLSIPENIALFALIGTTYGGNGQTTFALPDLRGRVVIGQGRLDGVNYALGQKGGNESVSLTIANLPSHNHLVYGSKEVGNTSDPSGAYVANTLKIDKEYKQNPTPSTIKTMGDQMVGTVGQSTAYPISIMQPVLAINYCINIDGIYPTFN